MTALALTALLLLCLHETGCRVHGLSPGAAPAGLTRAESMALGMAVWIAIGGVLNSIDAARPVLLAVLVAPVLVAAIARLMRGVRQHGLPMRELLHGWPLAPLLVVVGVIAVYAMPTAALNVHDDLRNYLLLPYRMLGTGTLAGSVLDAIGVDALGGQSFMQALVLSLMPAGYAPLFDNVLCLLLAGVLLDAVGRRLACPASLRLVAMLLFVMLDAQSINLSAVYSAAALLLALLLLLLRVVEGTGPATASAARGIGLHAGMLAAALCTLKMPHAVFALLLLGGLVPLLAWLRTAWRGALVGAALGAGALSLLPWLVVLWRTHGASLAAWLGAGGAASVDAGGSLSGLLAETNFYYASAPVDALWLLLFASLCVLVALLPGAGRRAGGVLAVALLASSITLVTMTVLVDAPAAVRFVAPLLIVITLACLQAAGARLMRFAPRRRALAAVAALLLCAVLVGQRSLEAFVAQARAVVGEARIFRVSMSEADRRAVQRALGIEAYDLIRGLQSQVPAGAVLLAPVGLGLHFDFARNPIVSLHGTALGAPWTPVPADVDAARLAGLLADLRVEYVLLQDAGIGVLPRGELLAMRDSAGVSAVMKRLAAREIAWRDALDGVAAGGRPVYASPPLRLLALPR